MIVMACRRPDTPRFSQTSCKDSSQPVKDLPSLPSQISNLEFEGMCRAFYDLCPIWICCQKGLDLLVHFKAFQGTQDSRRSVAQSVDPSQTCPAGQESGTYHPPSALVSSILSPSKSPLLKVPPRDLDLLQQSPWLVLQTLLYQIFLSDFVCCLS